MVAAVVAAIIRSVRQVGVCSFAPGGR